MKVGLNSKKSQEAVSQFSVEYTFNLESLIADAE